MYQAKTDKYIVSKYVNQVRLQLVKSLVITICMHVVKITHQHSPLN